MKYNRLHTAFLIVSLAFIGLMVDSCKSKKQEIPPFIDVHLEVKDANNVPSTGATVYLYNTEDAFQAAYQNSLKLTYNSIGSILTTTISDGKIDLKGLPSNTGYWILVHDTSDFFHEANGAIVSGYKVDKDNSEAYYKIDGFQNGTTVMANITLQPVTSLIKFANNSGGVSQVRLNDATDPVSIPQNYVKVRKGNIGYQARNTDCVWTGEIDAAGGLALTENLVKCDSKLVTFVAPSNLVDGQIIQIYIGQNASKPMGTLSRSTTSVTLVLALGDNYTYFAESSIGGSRKCVYEGAITNSVITLDPCN